MRRLALLAALALASCTVGPDFHAPAPYAATTYNDRSAQQGTDVTEAADPDPNWWNQFHDPVLTALMRRAIAGNPSLQESLLRVVSADQNEVTAGAAGLPDLSGNGSFMREQLGAKGLLESNGAYAELDQLAAPNSPLNAFSPGLGGQIANAGTGALNSLASPTNLYQYGLSASWELDLFGQVRRSVEAARAGAQAQAAQARDALVMLESEVAQAYFGLRAAQMMAAAQSRDITAAQEFFALTQRRYALGLVSELDVAQAQTQLQADEAQLPDQQKQAQQAVDQLNILTGAAPGTLDAGLAVPGTLPALPPQIGIGLPSTLARRRPDVQQAEAALHQATAEVGVAVASFYPSISLTGSAGLRALDSSYLTNWASLFYSAGPTITLPIFAGGRLTAQLRMARAAQAEAALGYRDTVLNALREVEDALVAYRTDRAAEQNILATEQSAATALDLANTLYGNGLTSYLNVLSAQTSLERARQNLIQAEAGLDNDAVTLFTALGGGWRENTVSVPQPALNAVPPPLPAAADSLAD